MTFSHSYTSKSFHPASQLLLRNLDRIRSTHCLIVNYPSDHFLLYLKDQHPEMDVTAFSYDYAAHQQCYAACIAAGYHPADLLFSALYTPAGKSHDTAIVFLPKGRLLTQMILTMLANALEIGTQVLLVGHNNAGIRSSRSLLAEMIGPAMQWDAARHCLLLHAMLVSKPASFHLEDWAKSYEIAIGGESLRAVTFPGVFSHGHLDTGTALLLDALEPALDGRILDFGCGCGVIGAAIRKLCPEQTTVEMIDTDAFALEATRRTMFLNELPIDVIQPSNIFSNVQGTFTTIVSNPPFHKGVETEYRTTIDFIKESGQHLEKGGILRIVANRFLNYLPTIEAHIGRGRVIAENQGFCVYEAAHS